MAKGAAPSSVIHALRRREDVASTRAANAAIAVTASLLVGFLLWASVAQVPVVTRAEGAIEPAGALLRVEHFDGGIVTAVHARVGDRVRAGAVLAEVEEPGQRAERAEIQARIDALEREKRRLRARLDGEALAADGAKLGAHPALVDRSSAERDLLNARRKLLRQRIALRESSVLAAQRLRDSASDRLNLGLAALRRFEDLHQRGLVSEVAFNAQRSTYEAVRADLLEAESDLARADSERAEAVSAAEEAELANKEEALASFHEAVEESARLQARVAEIDTLRRRRFVRAPQTGDVQTSEIRTRGEVVRAGDLLFEVLPLDAPLVATVRLSPKDIGHVKEGDQATIRVTTFDFRRYGGLTGAIAGISPTSITDETGETFFRARVAFEKAEVGSGALKRAIQAGMEVTAEISTARRTLISYLLKPIERAASRIFSER